MAVARPTHAQLVARRFGARAAQYDEHALLQRATAAHLAQFLEQCDGLPSGPVVEIGCGTGLLTRLLAPMAQAYLATDIAPEMVARCRENLRHLPNLSFAVQDGEQAVLAGTAAAMVSNLTAQWFQDPVAGLARLAAQTRMLCFSVPLAGSFPEWEQAFRDLGRASGLLPLPEEAVLRRELSALPGRTARFEVKSHLIRYASAQAFADSFRSIGADQPRPGYRPAPIRDVVRRFAQGMDATALVLYGCIKEAGA